VETRLGVLAGVDQALVLVAPDDQVEPGRQDLLREVAGRRVGVVVLVEGEQIEKVALLLAGAEELDLVIAKGPKHSLVPDVAQAEQGELGASLLQEDRLDLDVVGLGDATKVVDEPRRLQEVERAKVPVAARVVVVAVDGEDWEGHVDVGVLIVDVAEGALENLGRVAEELELAGLHPEAVLPEGPDDLVHGFPRGFVVVEEVPGEENHVDLLRVSGRKPSSTARRVHLRPRSARDSGSRRTSSSCHPFGSDRAPRSRRGCPSPRGCGWCPPLTAVSDEIRRWSSLFVPVGCAIFGWPRWPTATAGETARGKRPDSELRGGEGARRGEERCVACWRESRRRRGWAVGGRHEMGSASRALRWRHP